MSDTTARHSSESNEHYSPSYIVEAARHALGRIDLDPASCEEANRTVKAASYFTQEDNGFRRDWRGTVFLNPHGGRSDDLERHVLVKCRETGACGIPVGHTHEGVESSQKKWWFKLVREWAARHVTDAVFVCFSVELLQSSQVGNGGLHTPLDFPICFPTRRVPYVKPGGKVGASPPHASCIVCVSRDGEVIQRFHDAFGVIGQIKR